MKTGSCAACISRSWTAPASTSRASATPTRAWQTCEPRRRSTRVWRGSQFSFQRQAGRTVLLYWRHRRQRHGAEQAGVADGPDGGVEAAALGEAGEVGVVEVFPVHLADVQVA